MCLTKSPPATNPRCVGWTSFARIGRMPRASVPATTAFLNNNGHRQPACRTHSPSLPPASVPLGSTASQAALNPLGDGVPPANALVAARTGDGRDAQDPRHLVDVTRQVLVDVVDFFEVDAGHRA